MGKATGSCDCGRRGPRNHRTRPCHHDNHEEGVHHSRRQIVVKS